MDELLFFFNMKSESYTKSCVWKNFSHIWYCSYWKRKDMEGKFLNGIGKSIIIEGKNERDGKWCAWKWKKGKICCKLWQGLKWFLNVRKCYRLASLFSLIEFYVKIFIKYFWFYFTLLINKINHLFKSKISLCSPTFDCQTTSAWNVPSFSSNLQKSSTLPPTPK